MAEVDVVEGAGVEAGLDGDLTGTVPHQTGTVSHTVAVACRQQRCSTTK